MAAKLKVTQVKSTISHIARNRATVRALGLKGIGSTSTVADNPATRGMVRQVRFLVTVEETRRRRLRGEGMKLHDLQPAEGSPQGAHPGRARHRGRQGQDRGPRHQGPEGARRRLDPAVVRGRPDAAPHADPEAARLQEPVPRRIRGRERRRHRCARRRGRVRAGRGTRQEGRQARRQRRGRPDHGQPGHPARRRASSGPSTSRSRSSGPASSTVPLFVVADAFTASARTKIEAAGGVVNVLEMPTQPLAALGVEPDTCRRGRAAGQGPADRQGRAGRRGRARRDDAAREAGEAGQGPQGQGRAEVDERRGGRRRPSRAGHRSGGRRGRPRWRRGAAGRAGDHGTVRRPERLIPCSNRC